MPEHFTFLGINPSQIKVNDFEKDEDYTTYADENGDWFEEHTIQLKGGPFDRMTIKVSEHAKNDPIIIWFEKDVCTLSNLIVLTEEVTSNYGERYMGERVINPFRADSNDLVGSFSFDRRWRQLSITYKMQGSPQLIVHATMDERGLES